MKPMDTSRRITPGFRNASRRASQVVLSALLILAVASCLPAGVSDVSRADPLVSVISDSDLYVISSASQAILFYARRPDIRFPPLFTPDGQSIVYVNQRHQLVRQPLDGGPGLVLLSPVGQPGPGGLVFLPNGNLLVIDNNFNFKRYAVELDAETGIQSQRIENIGQVFISASAVSLKSDRRKADGLLTAARFEAREPGQFKVVFEASPCLLQDRTCLYRYSAEADAFSGEQLPRSLTGDVTLLFSRRVSDDATSGLLTPDGRFLILRVNSGDPLGTAQSLYAVDLDTNAAPVALLRDVPLSRRFDYTIAPAGDWIVYEEFSGGVFELQRYNLATGEKTTIAEGAFDPQWWK